MTDALWPPAYSGTRASSTARLYSDAWAAWNASYHARHPDLYRAAALALYQQAVAERIQALFARSDEQNARLDAMARSDARKGAGCTRSEWPHGHAA